MLRADLGLWAAVISHARPHRVAPMQTHLGRPATWYVGQGEAADYRAGGAESVVESGALCDSRNAALRAAGTLPCLQVSDDLTQLRLIVDGAVRPAAFEDVARHMLQQLRASPFRLVGVAPTDNAFYFNARAPVTFSAFVVGDLFIALPGPLRFDPLYRLKEDYDYTLQHWHAHGGLVRCNDVLASFAHRTNAGGAVAVRTPELEQQAIARLRAKWGDALVRLNPRRDNEVVLRLPSAAARGRSRRSGP